MRTTIKLVGPTVALSAILIALAFAMRQSSESRFVISPEMLAAAASITGEALFRHVMVLASDQFEGRAPGARGEELTVNYLIEQFKQFGLKPGNPDGSYVQRAPLIGIKSRATAFFVASGQPLALRFPEDYAAYSPQPVAEISVQDADIVFAGYGIAAPEYGWDDYKGTDVRGKTLLMLLGEPQVPDPNDPTRLDDKMFKGRAKSYYALWYHKLRIAAEKGAAAAIFVPENQPGAATYQNIIPELRREALYLKANGNSKSVKVVSVVSLDGAKKLIAGGGRDWESLQRAAQRKEFKPLPLEAKASFRVQNKAREFVSRNVVALCEGSDTRFRNEYVIYTAHWDHLGRDENLTGDQIYNGALDNATGTAGLLAIAQAYKKMQPAPRRSILFLATTAEEEGCWAPSITLSNRSTLSAGRSPISTWTASFLSVARRTLLTSPPVIPRLTRWSIKSLRRKGASSNPIFSPPAACFIALIISNSPKPACPFCSPHLAWKPSANQAVTPWGSSLSTTSITTMSRMRSDRIGISRAWPKTRSCSL